VAIQQIANLRYLPAALTDRNNRTQLIDRSKEGAFNRAHLVKRVPARRNFSLKVLDSLENGLWNRKQRVRKCSYCGGSSENSAPHCAGCGTEFEKEPRAADSQRTAPADNAGASVKSVYEQPWSARDAWKFLGMFVVFEVVLELLWEAVEGMIPGFRQLALSGAGHLGKFLLFSTVEILTMLYFSRVENRQQFLEAFSLRLGPTSYVWFAVVAALILRGVAHLLTTSGLVRGATTTSLRGFGHTLGLERWLFLAPGLMAPFVEELFIRGFLYRAFRGSYSVPVSVGLILAFTALTHRDQYARSLLAAVGLSLLTLLQCYLRERTRSVWDCIICHFVFNASGALAVVLRH
jgi:membrane protease YdiL (CAAX protease family)